MYISHQSNADFAGETGKYYCGMKVLTCSCCDGHCGPDNGCNCLPCQKLDQEEEQQHREDLTYPKQSQPVINSWTWGEQPGKYSCTHKPHGPKIMKLS